MGKETINVNDIFSMVIDAPKSQVGGGANKTGEAGSFMNSVMYQKNFSEFLKMGKSMEVDLKSVIFLV
jgi:hypothetical protein